MHQNWQAFGHPLGGLSPVNVGRELEQVIFAPRIRVISPTYNAALLTGTIPSAVLSSSKAATSIYDHFADVSNSGTAETTLYSDGIGAGLLATNGDKVLAEFGGTFSGAVSATQELRVYFGPLGTNGDTLIFDSGALAIGVASPSWDLVVTVIRQSSSAVRVTVSITTSSTALASSAKYTAITGLTLANNQFITITGTAAGVAGGSNQLTASMGYAQYAPA